MTNDSELTAWREAWNCSAESLERAGIDDIRRAVRRKGFYLRLRHFVEIGWALFLLAFSFIVSRRHPSTEMTVWALVVWALTLFASGYSIWNWRMLWSAEKRPSCEYAEVYEKYCIAGLREIRFGYYFLAVGLAIVVPWISWRFFESFGGDNDGLSFYLIRMGTLALLTAGYLVWFTLSRRKRLRELEQLRKYRKSLSEEIMCAPLEKLAE